jgi:16S rRNA G966 N2-methylase RsmD
VLADPPYAGGYEIQLLEQLPWKTILGPGGVFVLEWSPQKSKKDSLPDRAACLVKIREKSYGDTVLTIYQKDEKNEA